MKGFADWTRLVDDGDVSLLVRARAPFTRQCCDALAHFFENKSEYEYPIKWCSGDEVHFAASPHGNNTKILPPQYQCHFNNKWNIATGITLSPRRWIAPQTVEHLQLRSLNEITTSYKITAQCDGFCCHKPYARSVRRIPPTARTEICHKEGTQTAQRLQFKPHTKWQQTNLTPDVSSIHIDVIKTRYHRQFGRGSPDINAPLCVCALSSMRSFFKSPRIPVGYFRRSREIRKITKAVKKFRRGAWMVHATSAIE